MNQIEGRECTLRLAEGMVEACTGERCPFWDGDAAVGCVIHPIAGHVRDNSELAKHLLGLRIQLQVAQERWEAEQTRRLFYHLLNEEQAAEASST
jgi:hypothetical protein